MSDSSNGVSFFPVRTRQCGIKEIHRIVWINNQLVTTELAARFWWNRTVNGFISRERGGRN